MAVFLCNQFSEQIQCFSINTLLTLNVLHYQVGELVQYLDRHDRQVMTFGSDVLINVSAGVMCSILLNKQYSWEDEEFKFFQKELKSFYVDAFYAVFNHRHSRLNVF